MKQGENGRDAKGRFIKGRKGGERNRIQAAFRAFLEEKSFETLQRMTDMIMAPDATVKDVIAGTRLLLEYAYGKPAGEYEYDRLALDREWLKLEQKKMELLKWQSGPKIIEIIVDPVAGDKRD